MAGTKFCGSTSRLLLLSVPAFIMLSGAVVTEKARSCYWCGPQAEQVHRSQRAPPCGTTDNQVTTCDPGFPYCAIIATSPPYVESRLCVKLYQDECYPLFCNSTKTWKMTCPCRGELCNGPNAEREDEAFAILAKLVAKTRTTRIKKRTQQYTAKFIPIGDEKTLIITNISVIKNNEVINHLDDNTTGNAQVTQIMISNEPIVILQDMKSENVSSSEMAPTSDAIVEIDRSSTVDNFDDNNTITSPASKYVTTAAETTKTDKLVDNIVKPSEELPAAEALQQNTTPKGSSEKTTIPTTSSYETTYQTTTDGEPETTTMKHDKKNNGGNIFYTNMITIFIISIPLHIYKYLSLNLH